MFQTEFEFTLPCGYLDEDGTLHRDGVLRRATAADEIVPLRDPRVVRNPAYLTVILLARVVLRIGGLERISPTVIENLFATDLAYLQNLYNDINRLEPVTSMATCPECKNEFATPVEGWPAGDGLGG